MCRTKTFFSPNLDFSAKPKNGEQLLSLKVAPHFCCLRAGFVISPPAMR